MQDKQPTSLLSNINRLNSENLPPRELYEVMATSDDGN